MRRPGLFIAQLRFSEQATIDEHAAPHAIDVVCLDGSGFASVGAEIVPLSEGQRIHWPAGAMHRLWTDEGTMTTLMLEYVE